LLRSSDSAPAEVRSALFSPPCRLYLTPPYPPPLTDKNLNRPLPRSSLSRDSPSLVFLRCRVSILSLRLLRSFLPSAFCTKVLYRFGLFLHRLRRISVPECTSIFAPPHPPHHVCPVALSGPCVRLPILSALSFRASGPLISFLTFVFHFLPIPEKVYLTPDVWTIPPGVHPFPRTFLVNAQLCPLITHVPQFSSSSALCILTSSLPG